MMKVIFSNRSGQAAMEYMSTYGWALIVVTIAGIVFWQMGLFDIESRITPGFSGFSVLVPSEWRLARSGSTCTLSVYLLNGAGETINAIRVKGGNLCVPDEAGAGEGTLCSKTLSQCGAKGGSYKEMMVITYQRASDNQSFQTAGVLWGNIEAG